jgi:hypothetical protein
VADLFLAVHVAGLLVALAADVAQRLGVGRGDTGPEELLWAEEIRD